jgi:uridine phosphorylase
MNSIKESELIINPDGSIYHLHLKPGEISDTIITVGDPDRVEMVGKKLDKILFKKQHREFRTITGEINGKLITIISTGIGTDNVDIVLNELDALVNIDFSTRKMVGSPRKLLFIRIGTSGSVRKEIEINSIVDSKFAIGLDNLLHFYRETPVPRDLMKLFEENNFPVSPYWSQSMRNELIDHKFGKYDFVPGITVTLPGFYGPQQRLLRGGARMTNLVEFLNSYSFKGVHITNFEMETAGIFGLSQLLNHHCYSLNAILANRITGKFSSDPEKIIEKLIDKTLSIF